MKYDVPTTKILIAKYTSQVSVPEIAKFLTLRCREEDPNAPDVPEKSVIAKLSSLGVYKKKIYTTKRGEIPIKKSEYIDKIAEVLEVDAESIESLEKATKSVLALLLSKLEPADELAVDASDT